MKSKTEIYTVSKTEKAIKSAFSALLPVVYFVLCYKAGAEAEAGLDGVVWLLLYTFACALVYAVPFVITQSRIKARAGDSIKPYIAADALFVFLPAAVSSLASALLFYIFSSDRGYIWFFAFVLLAAFILITLYFWLSYYVNIVIARKIKSRGKR